MRRPQRGSRVRWLRKHLTATKNRKGTRWDLDMTLYPSARGCNPCSLNWGSLLVRGRRKRGRRFLIWTDKSSGPLPPALLTNAFANPLEVYVAGAISMTHSRPHLQLASLCCAKMPASVLDGGGEVMTIVHDCSLGSPRRLLGANLAPLGT